MRIEDRDGRDWDLIPFVLGRPRFTQPWAARSPLPDTVFLDVLDEDHLTFFRLLNAGNALAYGGLGMPDWMQLDVCTFPTAMIGFTLRRADVPADLWDRLAAKTLERWPDAAAALQAYDGLVPVSEFCGLHTPEAGTVMAFSVFSVLPGLRLGVRSKALGLILMEARRQMGVTRREGPIRRAHEVFGELHMVHDRPAPHPHAEESFVYEIAVPPAEVLDAILRTGRRPAGEPA
ncbi:MAG: hypothetical protein QNJ90_16085 [Planctomycetota bacterium]|nr:hypothetical protein [Planctomycetota bacterium]